MNYAAIEKRLGTTPIYFTGTAETSEYDHHAKLFHSEKAAAEAVAALNRTGRKFVPMAFPSAGF